MAGGGERKNSDFYSVLGLEKECTPTELRNAYKKLAMVRNSLILLCFVGGAPPPPPKKEN